MKKIKHIFLSIILLNVLFTNNIFAEESSENKFSLWGNGAVFKCDSILDITIFGTGAAVYGTDLILQKGLKFNQKEFDGNLFDKNDVNKFDRFFMQSYSKPLDTIADVLMITAIASPTILLATEDNSEWMTVGLMYAETILLAQGVKEISKLFINRARPYMYYEGFPEKDVYADLDWNNSCPSGHSTMSFMGATFLSYVFCSYNPDSAWRYPVVIGSYALATTTAILRVASGNHFATDILLGATLGTGIGILVPFLHTLTANKTNSSENNISKNKLSVSVTPLGIICNMRL